LLRQGCIHSFEQRQKTCYLCSQQTGTAQTEAIMIGFVMGHVGSIGSTQRARYLHQPVARESRQRRCCYRGPSVYGQELIATPAERKSIRSIGSNWELNWSLLQHRGNRNCSRQGQALAFLSERRGNCKLIGHGFGPSQGEEEHILVNHFPMKSQKDNTFTNYFVVRLLKQKPVLRSSIRQDASFPSADIIIGRRKSSNN
jgi:hypothetical protein